MLLIFMCNVTENSYKEQLKRDFRRLMNSKENIELRYNVEKFQKPVQNLEKFTRTIDIHQVYFKTMIQNCILNL